MTVDTEEPGAVWPADATRNQCVGDWFIYQRKGGHRTSTDDLVTAWLAVTMAEGRPVRRYLDLGCGIGSVLLMTVHALRPDYTLGVEAQPQSAVMARRTVGELRDAPLIEVLESDFREANIGAMAKFDVITGSPPYLPVGTGVMSPDAQRRACRFELRAELRSTAP